jgi:hypothetical protein
VRRAAAVSFAWQAVATARLEREGESKGFVEGGELVSPQRDDPGLQPHLRDRDHVIGVGHATPRQTVSSGQGDLRGYPARRSRDLGGILTVTSLAARAGGDNGAVATEAVDGLLAALRSGSGGVDVAVLELATGELRSLATLHSPTWLRGGAMPRFDRRQQAVADPSAS